MRRKKENSSSSRELLKEFVLSIVAGLFANSAYNLYMEIIRLLIK